MNALPALVHLRQQSHAPRRVLVINTVGMFNELATEYAPIIADMASDEDIAVRVSVMNALAKLGNRDPAVIAVIETGLKDVSREVRAAAEASLRVLNESGD